MWKCLRIMDEMERSAGLWVITKGTRSGLSSVEVSWSISAVVNSYFALYNRDGGTNSPTQWIDTIARWKTCSTRSPLVWNVIRLFAPAARRERLSPLAAHWGVGPRDGRYFRLIRHDEQYAWLSKNQRSKTKWRDRPLGRLQNSGYFFSPNR